ncbi:acyltransferase family protein [Microbacterium sp. YJN-G]|uniref:acyltransferase family protein n=1 Tax=Microbacterium sp. YJN-G TaxID=2763257 RepID=UPI001877DA04|nr:acyltransferase [Microbacterium sp. YJN-G]
MTALSPHRDGAIDLVRALCIIGVVTLHALMVGVTVSPAGPVFENAGETGVWLIPVSWMLQVMPLFFVIGGFSGATALRARLLRGDSPTAFVAARVRRLLVPAVAAVGTAGVLLALLRDAGVSTELVGIAGYRFGQPLWFLGVFLLCQALLPVMLRLHALAPLRSLAALAGAALAVDIVRAATGVDAVGFVNLAFVWLALQQGGFLLADGRIDALSARTRVRIGLTALALLVVSFALGLHSPDLIANINPPTTALLLVGVVHTMAFSLLRPQLARIAERRDATAVVRFVSARAMTIYLWHMPVLLTLAGLTALTPIVANAPLPAPASAEWWLSRPLWLASAFTLTALLAVPLSRLETSRPVPVSTSAARAVAATALGVAGVVLLLVVGTSPLTASVAIGCWLAALRLAGAGAASRAVISAVPAAAPRSSAAVAGQAKYSS